MDDRLYASLAALPLHVDRYESSPRELDVSSGFHRVTTVVALHGGGLTGSGEDVGYVAEDHAAYPTAIDLSGVSTFADFSARLGGQSLFDREPHMPAAFDYRRWAFESAGLDLALKQNRLSLADALGMIGRPVRFVLSTRLEIAPWLALYPELEFKLDPVADWDRDLMRRIAATGRVRVLDLKGYYSGTPVDAPPDAQLYRALVELFPQAILEDPALTDETRPALRGAGQRFSWDAPIHSWADVVALAEMPRYLNIKPSRFGTVAALLECVVAACEAGMTLYGGGQFELDVGRRHIQVLAALFYPDAPNDVAPREYHLPAPRPGLPRSPLTVTQGQPGF